MTCSNSLMNHRDIHEDCNWNRFYETPYRSGRRVMFNIPSTLEFIEFFEVIATARLRMREGDRWRHRKRDGVRLVYRLGSHRPLHALSTPMVRVVSVRAGCGSGRLCGSLSPRRQRWQAPETSPRTAGVGSSCMGLSGGPTSGGWRLDFPSNGWGWV